MTKKMVMLLTWMLATLPVFAQVPTEAYSFSTNLDLYNATSSEVDKIRDAEELIKRVIATEEFRNEILNHTYNGSKTFVDNGGYSNAQIYQKIIDGAEKLQATVDNEMDMEVEFYYENSSTVGYTNTSSKRIWVNRKFYNNYTAASCTSNLMHEWLHKLGFKHATYYSYSRDFSVPYAVGRIMSKLAATVNTAMTPPSSLAITRSGTSMTLTWQAATASSGIKEYKVFRRLDSSTTAYLQTTTTSLSFSQTAPTTGAAYYVRAVDNNGNTLKSIEIRFDPSVLQPVTNLALTSTSTSVKLTWSAAVASAGVKEYKIYRKLEGSTSAYLQGSTTSLSFSQTAPSKNAEYYVKTVDQAGKTINSTKVSYQKAAFTGVTNLTLSTTTSSVVLKWGAAYSPNGIKEYKVYRRLDGSSTIYLQKSTTLLSFSQYKPSKSATYYVRAVEAGTGNTIKSIEVRYTR